jgi:hypothetical protein
MSTLAEELEQDFADSSGSDNEQHDGANGLVDAVVDEQDSDVDMDGSDANGHDAANGVPEPSRGEDPDEARAKVEKMQLHGINDVRSVAGLMKTLQPVLEVSEISFTPTQLHCLAMRRLHLSCRALALTASVEFRKSRPTKQRLHHYPPAMSKTTPNTTSSRRAIACLLR